MSDLLGVVLAAAAGFQMVTAEGGTAPEVRHGHLRVRLWEERSPALAAELPPSVAQSGAPRACLSPLAAWGQPLVGAPGTLRLIAPAGGLGRNESGETFVIANIDGADRNQGLLRATEAGPVPQVMGCGGGLGSGNPGTQCGDPTPVGGTFTGFSFVKDPSVNAAGDTLFLADVAGGASTRGLFLRRADGQVLTVVALGDAAPGGGNFTVISAGALSDSGEVAFLARTGPLSAFGGDVYKWSAGVVSRVVARGEPAPGGGVFSEFVELEGIFVDGSRMIDAPIPGIDENGQVVFRAYVQGGATPAGLLRATAGGIEWLVRYGDPAPGGGYFWDFSWAAPVVARNGLLAFFAGSYDAGRYDDGWFVGRPGAWRAALLGSWSVGGRPITGMAVSHNPSRVLSDDGRLAVWAWVDDPADSEWDLMLMSQPDGKLDVVASEYDSLSGGGHLRDMNPWPAITDSWGRTVLGAYTPGEPGQPNAFYLAGPCTTVSVADTQLAEGQAGVHRLSFPVTLSAPTPEGVSVNYETADGSAQAGSDYVPASGTLSFAPGEVSKTVEVAVLADRVHEPDETMLLRLTGGSGAAPIDVEALGTILDDDPAGFAVADVRVVESLTGPATARFTVTLAPPVAGPATVDFATQDGTAHAPADYAAVTGQLQFAAGQESASVDVAVAADLEREGPETFTLQLSNPVGAGLAHDVATATISEAPAGDLGHDGRADLVWRHATSGEVAVWIMAGADRVGVATPQPGGLADLNWRLAGAHDFDGNGSADLLWRHALSGRNVVWLMNGTQRLTGLFLTPDTLADTNWEIAGTGYFDADVWPDIVWRHRLSGAVVVWLMNGTVRRAGTFTTPSAVPDVNWRLAGTGDLDADGSSDVVWQHALTGRTVVWLMNGAVRTSGAFTTPDGMGSSDWRITAVGDFDGDGRAELLWQAATSGELRLWRMQGAQRLEELTTTPPTGPAGWMPAAPR